MIGLSKHFMTSCDKCSKGLDVGTAMGLHNHKNLNDIYECKCGNKFTYIDGIINDYCSDLSFSEYDFISDIQKHGEIEIMVGKTSVVQIGSKCWINKVNLNAGGGIWLEAVIDGFDRFKILSSEIEDREGISDHKYPKIGDKQKVCWWLYARSFDKPTLVWNESLIKAKEQIINQDFLLSYFSSTVALESFYNLQFNDVLKKKGVQSDAIDIFLKESSFPDKIFKLSKSLLGIEHEKKARQALQKMIETRNKIAHGKRAKITREEAQKCFRNVVSVIFKYILYSKLGEASQIS
jgi:hypothetical protein